jgi:hypothetical protein
MLSNFTPASWRGLLGLHSFVRHKGVGFGEGVVTLAYGERGSWFWNFVQSGVKFAPPTDGYNPKQEIFHI